MGMYVFSYKTSSRVEMRVHPPALNINSFFQRKRKIYIHARPYLKIRGLLNLFQFIDRFHLVLLGIIQPLIENHQVCHDFDIDNNKFSTINDQRLSNLVNLDNVNYTDKRRDN